MRFSPEAAPVGSVVHIHGMGGSGFDNKFTWELGARLVEIGWELVAGDNRGLAALKYMDRVGDPIDQRLQHTGCAVELISESPIDAKAWAGLASSDRIVVSGHSLGCSKAILSVDSGVVPGLIGLLLLAPADMVGLSQHGSQYASMVAEARKFVDVGQKRQLLTGLHDDWTYISAQTFLEHAMRGAPADVINAVDVVPDGALSRVAVPILAVIGDEDPCMVVPPADGLEVLKKTAAKASVETVLIPGAGHSFDGHIAEMTQPVVEWVRALN